jgi:hypothetical protein
MTINSRDQIATIKPGTRIGMMVSETTYLDDIKRDKAALCFGDWTTFGNDSESSLRSHGARYIAERRDVVSRSGAYKDGKFGLNAWD